MTDRLTGDLSEPTEFVYKYRSDASIQAAMEAVQKSGKPFSLSLSPADYSAMLYALRKFATEMEKDSLIGADCAYLFNGMIEATGIKVTKDEQ